MNVKIYKTENGYIVEQESYFPILGRPKQWIAKNAKELKELIGKIYEETAKND